MGWIRDFARDERGEDLIEYGLLAAFVAGGVALLVLTSPNLRNAISEAFQKAISTLGIM
jgi:Flp pilus assembly pilin Flp